MPEGKGEIWWVVIVSTNVLKVISSFLKMRFTLDTANAKQTQNNPVALNSRQEKLTL
jgi:hypothetical protein